MGESIPTVTLSVQTSGILMFKNVIRAITSRLNISVYITEKNYGETPNSKFSAIKTALGSAGLGKAHKIFKDKLCQKLVDIFDDTENRVNIPPPLELRLVDYILGNTEFQEDGPIEIIKNPLQDGLTTYNVSFTCETRDEIITITPQQLKELAKLAMKTHSANTKFKKYLETLKLWENDWTQFGVTNSGIENTNAKTPDNTSVDNFASTKDNIQNILTEPMATNHCCLVM